jgi:long-chain acyl-CoA synthetase
VMTLDLHRAWGRAKRGSVGRALPGAALRVVDPDSGAVLAAGEAGLLEVIAPRVGPDWIRTADLAVIDADDFLWLHGRADGAIIRGGFKLLPEVIERALNAHERVADSAVAGIPDPRLGQIPVALIRLHAGGDPVDAKDLEAYLRVHLPATHIPAAWQFIEEIPRNASMKTDRRAVAALFDTP